jgi:hypothetical protein
VLPRDVRNVVLSFLKATELYKGARIVSKQWKLFADDEVLWHHLSYIHGKVGASGTLAPP